MIEDKSRYRNFENFLVRIPLLPLSYIQSVFDEKDTSLETLKKICNNEIIQEAIFLASPVLHKQLMKWINNKLESQKKIEDLSISIVKYLLRMGSRCTPFGIFAGYGLGKIKDITNIELNDIDHYYAHMRLDMNYLCALAIDLAKIPEIKCQIKFYPNTSIYIPGKKLRYVEYKYINGYRNHFIVEVDNSEHIQKVLQVSKTGATINTLAKSLVDKEIYFKEAEDFIEELIGNQLLISELEPSVTGSEFLDQIINTLKPLKETDYILEILDEINRDIEKKRNQPIGSSLNIYEDISEKLSKFKTNYDVKYLFQTDMVVSCKEIVLKSNIADDIIKGFEIMNRLTLVQKNENLSKFKEAFYERYEEREVPLSKALDVESGIGYIQNYRSSDVAPLIDDIMLPVRNNRNNIYIQWSAVQSLLLKKYNEAISKGLNEIKISDDDVKNFPVNWDDLPSTVISIVEIIESPLSDKKDPYIYINSVGGSSAVNLMGRFCHSNKDLYRFVKNISEKEQSINRDVILAEIVHLPDSRVGNVLLRPQLYEHEIPYLAKSSVSIRKQIPVDDLLISVKHGRKIVLRSKSLNKEVIPRNSTAHIYSYNALPVYQFLCDMQTQDLRGGVRFNWGIIAKENSFLPRVKYKNIILSKAVWNIRTQDIKELINAKGKKNIEVIAKIWKENFKLPDYVLLVDGDQELLLNLNNLLCIKTLISLVRNKPAFQLNEFLFNTKKTLVKRGEDQFTNQIIFSFYKTYGEQESNG